MNNKNVFQVGYTRWVLMLIIAFDIAGISLLASIYLYDFEGITNAQHVLFGISIVWLLGHFMTVFGEYRRNGIAIIINDEGIGLYRASAKIIPWTEIQEIGVQDLGSSSRSISITMKDKPKAYKSPYPLINIHKLLTFGSLYNTISMYLDGIACKNQAIRDAINKYGGMNV